MEEHRPTPLVEDIEGTRRKLAAWFSARLGSDAEVSELSIPQATGMSNVTLLFELRWQEGGKPRRQACVGRLQPAIAKPVFPDYDLSLQYRIMEILSRDTDIPAPEVLGLEEDPAVLGVPFYIMKKTDGRIPTDMPPYNMDGWLMRETTLEQRERLWNAGLDVMARYHCLDHEALGLTALFAADSGRSSAPSPEREQQPKRESQPGRGGQSPGAGAAATPLQRQLRYWRDYHDWGMEGIRHEICAAALDWLEANQPANEPMRLCWGDSRISNIIFSEDCARVNAVLDWEMAVLGNPLQDLAWYCYIDSTFAEGLGCPRLPGFPSYEATVERWRSKTHFPVDDYRYYAIFAAMRYGLILSRIMHSTGQDNEVQGNFACKLLQKIMDRP